MKQTTIISWNKQKEVSKSFKNSKTFNQFIANLQKIFIDLNKKEIKIQIKKHFGIVNTFEEAKKHKCMYYDYVKKNQR